MNMLIFNYRDINHCQGCNIEYNDEEADDWVGCSGCWRWFHYWCGKLKEVPDPDVDWFCRYCLK